MNLRALAFAAVRVLRQVEVSPPAVRAVPPPAPARPAPVDRFTPAVAVSRAPRVSAQDKQLITAAFIEALDRPPTRDELRRHASMLATLRAQGKTSEELKSAVAFVLANTPEWQARASYQERLGRLPTPEELSKAIAWGQQLAAEGKSVSEMRAAFDFVLSMTPEWQARDEYAVSLGRAPSPDELEHLKALGADLQAQGKSVEEMRAAFHFVTCCTPEWQARDAYQVQLGRLPTPDELERLKALGADLQAQGKSVAEMRAAFDYVIALTPEWQERHRPRLTVDRDAIYLQQPNGWTCGPTSLAMALAACGVRPADASTIWEMVDALGARAGVGTPGGVGLIAQVARRFGVNAESSPSREPADIRAALERGHGVIVNGDIGGGGHFLYLAGIDETGRYIVCDPWRPGITRWDDGDLWAFTHRGNNPPGFAEVWPR
jgi:hypothetical protein